MRELYLLACTAAPSKPPENLVEVFETDDEYRARYDAWTRAWRVVSNDASPRPCRVAGLEAALFEA